jgi:hypothetical protein
MNRNIEPQELRAQPASLFDNASDYNPDDYLDELQEQAETELVRMGVGSRRSVLSDDFSW